MHYDNYNLHCVEISIHALLAESDEQAKTLKVAALRISIHALLAESDLELFLYYQGNRISIHALLAESDKKQPGKPNKLTGYFYPRSPCGERHSKI